MLITNQSSFRYIIIANSATSHRPIREILGDAMPPDMMILRPQLLGVISTVQASCDDTILKEPTETTDNTLEDNHTNFEADFPTLI